MSPLLAVFAQSISGPQSQHNVPPGNDVIFSIVLTGHIGVPSYFWQKNGAIINDGAKYTGTKTATLTVMTMNNDDNGVFSCTVIVDEGAFFSSAAALTICKYIELNTGSCYIIRLL